MSVRSVSHHFSVSALRASKFGPRLACSTMPTDTETLRDSVELIIGIETEAEDASSNISDAPPFSPPKSRARRSEIGRASCRERVKISGAGGTLKKKKERIQIGLRGNKGNRYKRCG